MECTTLDPLTHPTVSLKTRDMETMQEMQRCLFPPRVQSFRDWEFAAVCLPARNVAGDYYDFFEVAPGQMGFALGDVSGKGPGPALVSANLHALIRGCLPRQASDLTRLIAEINDYLMDFTPEHLFVTLFVGVLDLETGCLRYVNAGHLPPLVLAGHGETVRKLTGHGGLLGVTDKLPCKEQETVLGAGSLMTLFSDGLTEAMDSAGQMFGEEGVLDCLEKTRPLPARVLLGQILDSVDRFVNRGHGMEDGWSSITSGNPSDTPKLPAHDDLSLLVIRRNNAVRGRETRAQQRSRAPYRAALANAQPR